MGPEGILALDIAKPLLATSDCVGKKQAEYKYIPYLLLFDDLHHKMPTRTLDHEAEL